MSKIKKGLVLLKEYGFKTTFSLVKEKLTSGGKSQHKKLVRLVKDSLSEKNYDELDTDFTISILVPVYNTDAGMLKCVIESVINQCHGKWELCIYDASDREHEYVAEICREYMAGDTRIIYKKGENKGISDNTNECALMAGGEYFGLLDHDDVLHRDCLYEVAKTIKEKQGDFIYTDEATFSGDILNLISSNFKPDYSPYTLRSNNYICHFTCFKRTLYEAVGGFRREYDGSQDHDLFMRMTERAKRVIHIPKLLYFWRASETSVVLNLDSKKYAIDAGINCVRDFILSKNIEAEVESSEIYPTIYRIKYDIKEKDMISIIILNHEHVEDLRRCIASILKSTYTNFEIIIVENNSKSEEIFDYYSELKKDERIKIVEYNRKFNYSEFNNYGVKAAKGKYLLFLNNDTEVISENWLEEMLMYAMQNEVGAVGARLFYPNGTLQHCYVITGIGEDRVAVHAGLGLPEKDYGYLDRIGFIQNVNAVTAACLMMRKEVFLQAGGFDEKLAVAYNDVDLCVNIRNLGYQIIYTPYARLKHYESASRGSDFNKNNVERFRSEAEYIKEKWKAGLEDPYYNPNFSRDRAYMLK